MTAMTPDIKTLAEELLALAGKATAGPWARIGYPYYEYWIVEKHEADLPKPVQVHPIATVEHAPCQYEDGWYKNTQRDANAAYIAAANPEAITALCTAVVELTRLLTEKEDQFLGARLHVQRLVRALNDAGARAETADAALCQHVLDKRIGADDVVEQAVATRPTTITAPLVPAQGQHKPEHVLDRAGKGRKFGDPSTDISELRDMRAWFSREQMENNAALIDRIISRLSGLSRAEGWRDIATAPKDGTRIDIWGSQTPEQDSGYERYTNAYWCQDHAIWKKKYPDRSVHIRHATHWRPLPRPPTGTGA